MKFMCLVYLEPEDVAGLSPADDRKLTDDTIEADHALRASGHLILAQPLQDPHTAVTVKVRNGVVSTTDGPFAETKEWLAGFFLIEAADMAEARAIAATSPIAKVGAIEVRPALEQTHSKTGQGRPTLP
jgi:hypothetical protein